MKIDQIKTPLHLLPFDDAQRIVLEVRDMRSRAVEKAAKAKKETKAKKPRKATTPKPAPVAKPTKEDILKLMNELGLKGKLQ